MQDFYTLAKDDEFVYFDLGWLKTGPLPRLSCRFDISEKDKWLDKAKAALDKDLNHTQDYYDRRKKEKASGKHWDKWDDDQFKTLTEHLHELKTNYNDTLAKIRVVKVSFTEV